MKAINRMIADFVLLLALGVFVFPLKVHAAQTTADPLQALGIYPADIRAATAEVLQYPGVLLELEKYRQIVRGRFNELLSSYPPKTQENVRRLVPYRKLWRALGTYLGDEKGTKDILKSYPKEIQSSADYLLKNSPDIIGKVASLEKETYQQFFQMVSGLAPQAQAAFKKVGQQSGILSILSTALNLSSAGQAASPELKAKSQNLATQLLALNKNGKSSSKLNKSGTSEASANLEAASEKMGEGLDSQIDQDPYSDTAIQANVTFSPNPAYNAYWDLGHQPYWY